MAEKATPKKEKKVESSEKKVSFDPWKIISFPHLTEKSMNLVEMENKLVFIVQRNFNKDQIREAIEAQFNVKVDDVKTVVTTKGKKKVIARLTEEFSASDIASSLGVM